MEEAISHGILYLMEQALLFMSKISCFFFSVCLLICLRFIHFRVSLFDIVSLFLFLLSFSFSARKMRVVRFKFTILLSFITNVERSRWVRVESLLFICLDVSLFAFCMFRPYTYHVYHFLTNQKGGFCFRIYPLTVLYWVDVVSDRCLFHRNIQVISPLGFHANSRLTWCGLILPTSSCFRCKQIDLIKSKLWQSISVTELIPLARGRKSPLKNQE